MKKILVAILALITGHVAVAQRAEMEKVNVNLKLLPSKPLPSEIVRYNYRVLNSTSLSLPSPEVLNGYFSLDGFQFSSASPDVTLLVYLDKYEEKFFTTPIKGISETKYAYGIKSSIGLRLAFLTGDSMYEFYHTSKLLKEDDSQYLNQNSLTFATEEAAAEAGKKDETLFRQAKEECMKKTLWSVQQYLKFTHAYPTMELTIPVWSMKAKSFDYSDMDEAQGKAIAALKNYSGNGLNEENKKLFQEAIVIWEKVLTEFNPNDKKGRVSPKNVGALYANLALTNNWILNDDQALKYLNLLSESRGSSWADMIGEIVHSDIKGREQDGKRKSNVLVINKTKSSYYVSPDFIVKGHSHRISALQKDDMFMNKKLPVERRYFEYADNGLLSRTYTESYNASNKTWEKRRDIHTIKYDHDQSIMYVYNEKSATQPMVIRKFKDGKLIYQRTRTSAGDSSVLKFYYNPAGQLERYVLNPHSKPVKTEAMYEYENGQLIRKQVSTDQGGQLKPLLKEEYKWVQGRLTEINSYRLTDPVYATTPAVSRYYYDSKGFLSKAAYTGYEETFSVDEWGNITDIHVRDDQGGSRKPTQIWEPGAGNALLYTTEFFDYRGPEYLPALY